jgi:gliding motility-associated-like protein
VVSIQPLSFTTTAENSLRNPIHTYIDTGAFCPQLVVVNDKGCIDTTTQCLEVEPLFSLYIPNAFSPNGDGLNDIFVPKGDYLKNFEMYIFDRWGQELFHSTDISNGWNGTVKGGNIICQEDSYVYKITVTDWHNKVHSYIGEFMLLK